MPRHEQSALTSEKKVEIAVRFFGAERMSQRHLADEYGVSPATINRAIRDARDSGWVTVTVTNNMSLRPVERDDNLEEKLWSRFPQLRTLFVVRNDGPPQGASRYAVWSDHTHARCGNLLGSACVCLGILDEDRIGVSSGRGVFATVDAVCRSRQRQQAQNVWLLSLTGSYEMKAQAPGAAVVMDGDLNAAYLARAFSREIRLQTTCRGLAMACHETLPTWFDEPLTKVLAGIGVLEGSNRMLTYVPAEPTLREQLRELSALVHSASRGNYVPCADVCNHLFWVPPPRGIQVAQEARIRALIDEINLKFCAIGLEKLCGVRHGIWIAAAGPRKAAPLRFLIEKIPHLNALSVDSTLAEALLALN